MKKHIFILLFIAAFSVKNFAQLGKSLSQFSGNQMLYNPGYAGTYDILSVNLSIHRGWVQLPGAPSMISLNGHIPSKNHRNAFGLSLQNEVWGALQGNFIHGNYAFKVELRSGTLSFGLQAGALVHTVDWDRIEFFRHPEDVTIPQDRGRETEVKLDVNTGVYYLGHQFYAGFSVMHVTNPKYGTFKIDGTEWFSQMRSHFIMIGGYNFQIDNKWAIRPEVLLQYIHTMPLSANIGTHLHYMNTYSFGANFMTGQRGVSFQARAMLSHQFRIGYSYDVFYGPINPFQQGSHEVSINYIIPNVWNNVRTVNLLWL